jgi:hypothetical protein
MAHRRSSSCLAGEAPSASAYEDLGRTSWSRSARESSPSATPAKRPSAGHGRSGWARQRVFAAFWARHEKSAVFRLPANLVILDLLWRRGVLKKRQSTGPGVMGGPVWGGRQAAGKADSQAFCGKRLPHRWLGSWPTKPVDRACRDGRATRVPSPSTVAVARSCSRVMQEVAARQLQLLWTGCRCRMAHTSHISRPGPTRTSGRFKTAATSPRE